MTSSAGVTSSDEHSDALADIKLHTRERKMIEEQTVLFSDPEFFRTPVIMLHCQWTDFAVSFHAPDKYVMTGVRVRVVFSVPVPVQHGVVEFGTAD